MTRQEFLQGVEARASVLIAAEFAANPDYLLELQLGIANLMALVANLQLALRHPANRGRTANMGREIVDQIIARLEEDGLLGVAAALRLGDNPEHDTCPSNSQT